MVAQGNNQGSNQTPISGSGAPAGAGGPHNARGPSTFPWRKFWINFGLIATGLGFLIVQGISAISKADDSNIQTPAPLVHQLTPTQIKDYGLTPMPGGYDFCSNLELMVGPNDRNFSTVGGAAQTGLRKEYALKPSDYSIKTIKISAKTGKLTTNLVYNSTGDDEDQSVVPDISISKLLKYAGGPDAVPVFLDTEATGHAAQSITNLLKLEDIIDVRTPNASVPYDINQGLLDNINSFLASGKALSQLHNRFRRSLSSHWICGEFRQRSCGKIRCRDKKICLSKDNQ